MLKKLCYFAILGLLSIVPAAARADILGPASGYNVFVFGNDTQFNTDAEGKVAVGGNANFTNYGIGAVLPFNANRYDLVVGGNLNFTNGSVNNGRIFVGGTPTLTSVGVGAGLFGPPTPSPVDFPSAKTQLQGTSTALSHRVATGTTTITNNEIFLNGHVNGVNVFNVHGSDLANASFFSVTVPHNALVLVNIDGKTDSMQNFGFSLNGTDDHHILYNFYQATSLNAQAIGIEGSLLAPFADMEFNNGVIKGTLIVNNLHGGGQANREVFTGTPEPASMVLAGIGLIGLVGYGWKRRRDARLATV